MNKSYLFYAGLIALSALLFNYQAAFAHESITIGDYEILYGWVNEPPIAGQINGVEIFVNNTSGGGELPVEEHIIHSLVVELTYGAEIKILTLEPVFDAAGAFDAPVLPTIPGVYSLKFSGTLGDTPVDTEVDLEEVQAADAVQFPRGASPESPAQPTVAGPADWLVWLTLVLALLGVGLGATALRKAG